MGIFIYKFHAMISHVLNLFIGLLSLDLAHISTIGLAALSEYISVEIWKILTFILVLMIFNIYIYRILGAIGHNNLILEHCFQTIFSWNGTVIVILIFLFVKRITICFGNL
jgi:hypothetical protein